MNVQLFFGFLLHDHAVLRFLKGLRVREKPGFQVNLAVERAQSKLARAQAVQRGRARSHVFLRLMQCTQSLLR